MDLSNGDVANNSKDLHFYVFWISSSAATVHKPTQHYFVHMKFGPSTFPVSNYLPVAFQIYLCAKFEVSVSLVLTGFCVFLHI